MSVMQEFFSPLQISLSDFCPVANQPDSHQCPAARMSKRQFEALDQPHSFQATAKKLDLCTPPTTSVDFDEFNIGDGEMLAALNQVESMEDIEDQKLVEAMLAFESKAAVSDDDYLFDELDANAIDMVDATASQYFQTHSTPPNVGVDQLKTITEASPVPQLDKIAKEPTMNPANKDAAPSPAFRIPFFPGQEADVSQILFKNKPVSSQIQSISSYDLSNNIQNQQTRRIPQLNNNNPGTVNPHGNYGSRSSMTQPFTRSATTYLPQQTTSTTSAIQPAPASGSDVSNVRFDSRS
jgi:hypothetical protein